LGEVLQAFGLSPSVVDDFVTLTIDVTHPFNQLVDPKNTLVIADAYTTRSKVEVKWGDALRQALIDVVAARADGPEGLLVSVLLNTAVQFVARTGSIKEFAELGNIAAQPPMNLVFALLLKRPMEVPQKKGVVRQLERDMAVLNEGAKHLPELAKEFGALTHVTVWLADGLGVRAEICGGGAGMAGLGVFFQNYVNVFKTQIENAEDD